jgi:hypothetical protein
MVGGKKAGATALCRRRSIGSWPTFDELHRMPSRPPHPVPIFTPSLRDLLTDRERRKGSPLTPAEVDDTLANTHFDLVPAEQAKSIAAERGYHDLDHRHLWGAWCRTREIDPTPYTNAEIATLPDHEWDYPLRGLRCPCCQCVIPQLAELTPAELAEIRASGPGNRFFDQRRLRLMTGCSDAWAKIWALHPDGQPKPAKPTQPKPPCPHCGRPLPTPRAKQCLFCGADWH